MLLCLLMNITAIIGIGSWTTSLEVFKNHVKFFILCCRVY